MRFTSRVSKWIVAAVLVASSSISSATIVFKDNFELGTLGAILNSVLGTAKWTDQPDVTVVTTSLARSGNYTAKFHYGNWAELRFDLGRLYPEIWMQWSVYVPANYVHRNGGDGPNNKFFRLWGNSYGDKEKIGYSTWPSGGYSDLQADWDSGTGMGAKGTGTAQFFGAADRGKWMTVRLYVKAATATAPGTMKMWKNGVLVINNSNIVNNYASGEPHAYRYGYLFGAANSGFAESTDFYVDDVIFATTEGELGGVELPVPNPPASVTVQ